MVVEEQAPVVTVRHGELSVGQCEPVEHLVHDVLVVVHERVGLPFLSSFGSELEHLECERRFTEFLHHHILVAGVEEIMVLESEVVVEVFSLIVVLHGLVVVFWVNDCGVRGISLMRIGVDGESAQSVEPLRSERIVGEESESGGEDVRLPSVLLRLGVAVVARRDGAVELIVALRLEQVVDVGLLLIGEYVPLEESRISHGHGPEAGLPDVVAGADRSPVSVVGANFEFVGFMRGICEYERLQGHLFDIAPADACRQCHLSLSIFCKESADHAEVGVRSHSPLIVAHGVFSPEASARLIHTVWRRAFLEVVLHVGGEIGEHLQEVVFHCRFRHEIVVDDTLGGTFHSRFCGVVFLRNIARNLVEPHVVEHHTAAS